MYIAVVTGASSGMGRAFARRLAEGLHRADEIWVIARRRERLKELCKEVSPAARKKIRIFAGDITEESFRESFSRELSARDAGILFLVNAAGFGKIGEVEKLSVKTQTDMADLNALSLVAMTGICLPRMVPRYGRIVNFASAAAFLPQPGFAVYAATKAFVLSFSEALGHELKDREIGVTAVCPGPVKTEFFDLAEEFSYIPVYKRLVMAKPEAVVKKAIKDSVKRRSLSVYGLSMKGLRIIGAVVPHRLTFRIMDVFSA